MLEYTRLAEEKDIDSILEIINYAKDVLKKTGSSQWQNGYPNRKTIEEDILNKEGYVLVVGSQVAAYAAVIIGDDPSYQNIDGAWTNGDDEYATVHRICIGAAFKGQGLARIFYSNIISIMVNNGIKNFRVDTHAANKIMQKLLKSIGHEYRGIIQAAEEPIDPERLAFELNL